MSSDNPTSDCPANDPQYEPPEALQFGLRTMQNPDTGTIVLMLTIHPLCCDAHATMLGLALKDAFGQIVGATCEQRDLLTDSSTEGNA